MKLLLQLESINEGPLIFISVSMWMMWYTKERRNSVEKLPDYEIAAFFRHLNGHSAVREIKQQFQN